jgi:hypothetical protein
MLSEDVAKTVVKLNDRKEEKKLTPERKAVKIDKTDKIENGDACKVIVLKSDEVCY